MVLCECFCRLGKVEGMAVVRNLKGLDIKWDIVENPFFGVVVIFQERFSCHFVHV